PTPRAAMTCSAMARRSPGCPAESPPSSRRALALACVRATMRDHRAAGKRSSAGSPGRNGRGAGPRREAPVPDDLSARAARDSLGGETGDEPRLGWGARPSTGSSGATRTPERGAATRYPSACSASSAWSTVVRATPSSAARVREDGRRVPGATAPDRMRPRSAWSSWACSGAGRLRSTRRRRLASVRFWSVGTVRIWPGIPYQEAHDRLMVLCSVVELRQYTLHPGRRDELVSLFERELVHGQEAAGI